MNFELSAYRYYDCKVRPGDMLYASPRKVRVFVADVPEAPAYVL